MNSIERFFAAWGDPDADSRSAAIGSAVATTGTYADPMTPEPLVGPGATSEYVAAFADAAPGATARVIDSQERHGITRATVEFEMADGNRQYGQYFVETDDHQITRMVGFVGLVEPAER